MCVRLGHKVRDARREKRNNGRHIPGNFRGDVDNLSEQCITHFLPSPSFQVIVVLENGVLRIRMQSQCPAERRREKKKKKKKRNLEARSGVSNGSVGFGSGLQKLRPDAEFRCGEPLGSQRGRRLVVRSGSAALPVLFFAFKVSFVRSAPPRLSWGDGEATSRWCWCLGAVLLQRRVLVGSRFFFFFSSSSASFPFSSFLPSHSSSHTLGRFQKEEYGG